LNAKVLEEEDEFELYYNFSYTMYKDVIGLLTYVIVHKIIQEIILFKGLKVYNNNWIGESILRHWMGGFYFVCIIVQRIHIKRHITLMWWQILHFGNWKMGTCNEEKLQLSCSTIELVETKLLLHDLSSWKKINNNNNIIIFIFSIFIQGCNNWQQVDYGTKWSIVLKNKWLFKGRFINN
jgi:hypothetical protein